MNEHGLIQVSKNDWIPSPSTRYYGGKYQVGNFEITDRFIVYYLKIFHSINIPTEWLQCYDPTLGINSRKVMYMEASNILTQDLLNEMRKAVKPPPEGVKIYRNAHKIVYIIKKDYTL